MKVTTPLLAAVSATILGVSCTSMQSSLSSKSRSTSEPSAAAAAKRTHQTPGSSARRMTVRTTAYSHQENEMGGIYGRKNACGTNLCYGSVRSAAADWSRFPVGTRFRIVGQPHIYQIDDYGSALVGTNTIDIYKPTLGMMNHWGVRHVDIEIVQWGSFERSAHILKDRTRAAHTRKMFYAIQPKLGKKVASAASASVNDQG